jgi:hypothetical protein
MGCIPQNERGCLDGRLLPEIFGAKPDPGQSIHRLVRAGEGAGVGEDIPRRFCEGARDDRLAGDSSSVVELRAAVAASVRTLLGWLPWTAAPALRLLGLRGTRVRPWSSTPEAW